MVNEQEQFDCWIRDHLGLIIKVVRSYTTSPDDQEDLLQEVLVNLWSSLSKFRGDCKESTWIYRVAIQTAMVWKRGERRRFKKLLGILHDASILNRHNEDRLSSDQTLIEQLYEAIRQLQKWMRQLQLCILMD